MWEELRGRDILELETKSGYFREATSLITIGSHRKFRPLD